MLSQNVVTAESNPVITLLPVMDLPSASYSYMHMWKKKIFFLYLGVLKSNFLKMADFSKIQKTCPNIAISVVILLALNSLENAVPVTSSDKLYFAAAYFFPYTGVALFLCAKSAIF